MYIVYCKVGGECKKICLISEGNFSYADRTMKNLLIYGTAKYSTPALLEQARLAALRAYRLVAKDWQVIVSDRHGIDAEVTRICSTWNIPVKVYGFHARPRNGVSGRLYERLLACPVGTTVDNLLNRYLMQLADTAVVIGETPDCSAMRLWARLNGKLSTPAVSTWRLQDTASTAVILRPLDVRRTTQTMRVVQ
jgi:hypothetical protein